jgi:hypothetical protein
VSQNRAAVQMQADGDLWYIDGPTGRVWIHEECHNFRLRYAHLAEDIR